MIIPPNSYLSPDRWTPTYVARTVDRPEVGDLIGWRYATWHVLEVRPRADADLSDDDRKRMAAYKPEARERHRPYTVVVRHERGPILVERKYIKRLHDGTKTCHLSYRGFVSWHILDDRYAVCACHGHPHPCQGYAADRTAEAEMKRMEDLLAGTAPGVCFACHELITTRQKAISFPELSLLVPGAPGPTFHAGRGDCWHAAQRYEMDHRLPANPDAARLASCPGVLFHHLADSREECTAQNACTGSHGPAGVRKSLACVQVHQIAANEGCYPRPPSDCGYNAGFGRCLGADLSLGAPDPLSVGDTIYREWRRAGWS